MALEHKAVGVNGLKVISEQDGVIETIVSVTGIRDNVNDIILPGAYEKSLNVRTPKGVWHHNWHESVSRTESIKELMPGDALLPKALPNGEPWPAEAGALLVKTRFNLRTTRGKDAYEDVLFFGDQQEWSIGYNVPVGGATTDSKSGIRKIHTLDLYEYSPVLFGAMPAARTSSVKQAQESYAEIKQLHGDNADQFLMEIKSIVGESAFVADFPEVKGGKLEAREEDQGLSDEDDEDDFIEEDEDEVEEKALAGGNDLIRKAIAALQACLDDDGKPSEDTQEEKSLGLYEAKELSEIIADDGYDEGFMASVKAFDTAVDSGDIEQMEETATPLLDYVEAMSELGGDDVKAIAGYVAEQFKALDEDDSEEEDADDEEELVEEDPEEDEAGTKSGAPSVEVKMISLEALNAALAEY